jgi:hypothetical protein
MGSLFSYAGKIELFMKGRYSGQEGLAMQGFLGRSPFIVHNADILPI